MANTPAVTALDSTGRLVCFINGSLFHVPLSGVLTTANLASLGLVNSTVDALDGVSANTTISVPAGWALQNIFVQNTTANAVTGGLRIGTTSGANDVLTSMAIAGNALVETMQSLDWNLRKRLFSTSVAQTLFIQAVTSWNGANLKIRIQRTKVF